LRVEIGFALREMADRISATPKFSFVETRVSESLESDSLDSDRNRELDDLAQAFSQNFFHMINDRAESILVG
jgi:hypothetical protein